MPLGLDSLASTKAEARHLLTQVPWHLQLATGKGDLARSHTTLLAQLNWLGPKHTWSPVAQASTGSTRLWWPTQSWPVTRAQEDQPPRTAVSGTLRKAACRHMQPCLSVVHRPGIQQPLCLVGEVVHFCGQMPSHDYCLDRGPLECPMLLLPGRVRHDESTSDDTVLQVLVFATCATSSGMRRAHKATTRYVKLCAKGSYSPMLAHPLTSYSTTDDIQPARQHHTLCHRDNAPT